ncbi:hypothetical protein XarbCFBP7408_13595 [Xanthomonas arboricola pv. guizotiae]|uniref:Uncharacterized protein n=1 Tax=Xanthomonas arboricola pv. guizotiae TaxID=487867 RepID=A0A2S6ZT83_9XANT|nr:hypothetical protein XarbCFBP7409_17495 [Xanthomonas arboricola pv. guizotiae]PPU22852.1 hypothetical protein XarbCFBP7408_13595 [Xanthomonas arboricola pv. guizotiae]
MAALGLFTASAQARVRAAGSHHTTSHGGHYSAGHGASHKGGSYRSTSTNNHYRRHKS